MLPPPPPPPWPTGSGHMGTGSGRLGRRCQAGGNEEGNDRRGEDDPTTSATLRLYWAPSACQSLRRQDVAREQSPRRCHPGEPHGLVGSLLRRWHGGRGRREGAPAPTRFGSHPSGRRFRASQVRLKIIPILFSVFHEICTMFMWYICDIL